MPRFIWLCLFGLLFARVQAAEPVAPVGLHVMHGTFANAKFWFRLQVPDKQFGVNRVCELVYTPPNASDLGGTQMSDCPFLLVDRAARIVAWNGRDIGTKVVPATPHGYKITHERHVGTGEEREIKLEEAKISGELGWDLRIAPILLALTWKADTSATVRLIDFFGPRHAEALTLTWEGTAVTISGVKYTIVPNAQGQLAMLTAADGTNLITIAAHQ